METPMSSIVQTGDLGGQKVQMRIDENALAHIMSVLTDLYSDPQMAVIREYSTNARDAHVEASNSAPIEITTPSPISPYFKVKDFGVGLSVDDIVGMYSMYGASTKRGTNEQTGMLGLGAKSALTLVPQFNIISVKNGVRILVSVSRAADGSGQMEIIDTKATNEPNGVEVSVPIPRDRGFADKCKSFFSFWPKGTVLVNGQEPSRVDGRWIGDDIVIDKSLNQDYIVMGNVAYPVREGLYGGGYYYSHMGIVAFVNIGDVNFTPSREQLQYTPRTKATIEAIKAKLSDRLIAAAVKDVDAAATHQQAWVTAQEWRKAFRNEFQRHTLTYKGEVIPAHVPLDGKWRIVDLMASRSSRGWSYVSAITPESGEFLFITGFADSLKMSPVQRERTMKYLEQQGISATKAAISHGVKVPDNNWTKAAHVVDWSVIAKIKIERVKSERIVRTEPYDLFTGSYGYTSTSTLDTSRDIIFISPAEDKQPGFLRTMYPGAQIVMLGMNRWDKFKRDYPTAKHYQAKINADKDGLVKQFTEDDKILWHYPTRSGAFRFLDADRVDDPELARFARVLSGKVTLSQAARAIKAMPGRAGGVHIDIPVSPLQNYPLAASIYSVDSEHLHWYVNAHYNTNLNKKEN